jgi:hypothetical protein
VVRKLTIRIGIDTDRSIAPRDAGLVRGREIRYQE